MSEFLDRDLTTPADLALDRVLLDRTATRVRQALTRCARNLRTAAAVRVVVHPDTLDAMGRVLTADGVADVTVGADMRLWGVVVTTDPSLAHDSVRLRWEDDAAWEVEA